MRTRIVSHPRKTTFAVAKRYLRRFVNTYMSIAYGGCWNLYRYNTHKGKRWMFVAQVPDVPDGVISGNFWTNPSRI